MTAKVEPRHREAAFVAIYQTPIAVNSFLREWAQTGEPRDTVPYGQDVAQLVANTEFEARAELAESVLEYLKIIEPGIKHHGFAAREAAEGLRALCLRTSRGGK